MEIVIACKGAPLNECIQLAESKKVGIEIKSFTSQLTYKSDWHGLLNVIKKQISNFNGFKALHGIVYVGPQTFDRMSLQNIRSDYIKCLQVAQELEVKVLIAHSTFIPGLTPWKYKDWLNCEIDLWNFIVSEAAKIDLIIAMENIIDNKPENILDVVRGVNQPNFKICLDFGHLNLIPSACTPLEWIDELKDYLFYTHLHNNNGRYDSHSSLDNGTLDFEAIFLKLLELDNIPKLAIEVDTIQGVRESLEMVNVLAKGNLLTL